MNGENGCVVVNGRVAVGVFKEPAEARRWGNICIGQAEGVNWAIAPVVAPEDFEATEAIIRPDLRIAFDSAQRCSAFTVHLHQLLPLLDAGGFLDYHDFAKAEGTEFAVYLKKPLPPDLLSALLVLTHHTRLPYSNPRPGSQL